MKKEIEFKNWWALKTGSIGIEAYDCVQEGYGESDGQRVDITLSPVEDPECSRREPDYKVMWKELKADAEKSDIKIECALHACIIAQRIMLKNEMDRIEAQHTPQAGVKKEEGK